MGDLKILKTTAGPWFIKDSDLIEGKAEQTFIESHSYLWDDVLKYKNKKECQSIVDMVSSTKCILRKTNIFRKVYGGC